MKNLFCRSKTVALRSTQDEGGPRHLRATLTPDGDVHIEGQDFGAAVEKFFGEGYTEYEYALTVRAADVPKLLAALGADRDPLSALQSYFGDPDTPDPQSFLKDHDIPFEFWSRVGE